jgi:hypothetical protein
VKRSALIQFISHYRIVSKIGAGGMKNPNPLVPGLRFCDSQFEKPNVSRVNFTNVKPDPPQQVGAGLAILQFSGEWLEKDIDEGSSWPVVYAVVPELEELRDAPRFKDMLKRLNLPE